jgi:deoxyribonuclease V
MKVKKIHSWELSYSEAVQVQKELIKKLAFHPIKQTVKYVAGADISYSKNDPRIFGAVVVIELPEMKVIEVQTADDIATFPYIPGLLAFRELPVLCKIFSKIKQIPDVVICDGQGIAHPREMGIASHLGLLLDIPTVGCAKTRLVGEYGNVGLEKGSHTPLIFKGKVVGCVMRTRDSVKPVFVSPGHQIDLETAMTAINLCTTKYRLPEPTRLAHIYVNKLRKSLMTI